jgi:hypothetical protein
MEGFNGRRLHEFVRKRTFERGEAESTPRRRSIRIERHPSTVISREFRAWRLAAVLNCLLLNRC